MGRGVFASAHERIFEKGAPPDFLAAKTTMNKTIRRILTVLMMICLLGCAMATTAFAAEATEPGATADPSGGTGSAVSSDQYMTDMGNEVMEWYRFLRDKVAVPFLILSFASCGFKIFSSAFLSRAEQTTNQIIQQFMTSAIALGILFMLPYIVGAVRELLEGTAWQPPASN